MRKHCRITVNLKAYLMMTDDELAEVFTGNNGEHVGADIARRQLAAAYGKGHDVLPVCGNPDERGYCDCDPSLVCGKPDCTREDHASGIRFCVECGTELHKEES